MLSSRDQAIIKEVAAKMDELTEAMMRIEGADVMAEVLSQVGAPVTEDTRRAFVAGFATSSIAHQAVGQALAAAIGAAMSDATRERATQH